MRLRQEIEKLHISLGLDKSFVGIKFLHTKQEYENSMIEQSKSKLSYCMMVKIASSGKAVKVRAENFKCKSSARVLGIIESSSHVDSGQEYYSYNMYRSLETAKKVHDEVAYLNKKLYGLIAQPLEEFKTEPDIVIMISSPYNAMRIIQGYTYAYSMAKNIRFGGNQGLCSELTARPYETDDLNVSLLCSNTRFSCKWKDGELGVAMPYNKFVQVAGGVLATMNAAEPDYKKEEMIERAVASGVKLGAVLGDNYYGSSIGVAKLDNKE